MYPRYLRAYTDTYRDAWEGCSVRSPHQRILLNVSCQIKRISHRNCKIEYDDSEILAVDAVVFHLHKVNAARRLE